LLAKYTGTLFLVSHDRTFLDNVVTQTIAAEGNGQWREYAGGYSDWANYKASLQKEGAARQKADAKQSAAKAAEPVKAKLEKLSWKEQRELEELPGKIAGLEAEQVSLSKLLEDPAIYQTDPPGAQKAAERLALIDDELIGFLERWEILEARSDKPA